MEGLKIYLWEFRGYCCTHGNNLHKLWCNPYTTIGTYSILIGTTPQAQFLNLSLSFLKIQEDKLFWCEANPGWTDPYQ